MKNRWVKRIATAVTALALAASVFTGLNNSVKAANNGHTYWVTWIDESGHEAGYTGDNAVITLNNNLAYDDASLNVHIGPYVDPGYFNVPAGKMQVDVTVITQNPNVGSASYSFEFQGETYSGTVTPTFDGQGMWKGSDIFDYGDDDDSASSNSKKDETPSDSSTPSTHKHHTHNWEWTALVNATENQDGTYAMKCTRCNKIDESTITVIAKESVTSDKNLQALGSVKPGETIKLDTKGTAAFNQYFIAELMKHSDSPLEVDFEYKNEKWTLTAPAGFNWPATLDDKGWAGFLRVAGENEEVTAVKR